MSSSPQYEVHVRDGDLDAFLVVDRAICDRACGGLRIAPDVTLEEIRGQAQLMTRKFALYGIACGGAKAGLVERPEWQPADRAEALRRLGAALGPVMRRGLYITGEDLGCGPADVWHLRRGAGLVSGTAPPPSARGTGGSGHHAGVGAALAALVALEHLRRPLREATIAVQGFGRVGRAAARELVRSGARLRAVSNAHGAIAADALDPDALIAFLEEEGEAALLRFPGSRPLARDALLFADVDVLLPCARPAAITPGNVGALRCRVIAAGGNCSVVEEAEPALLARGIVSIPDVLANSGGILVAHFAALAPSAPTRRWLLEVRFAELVRAILRTAAARRVPPQVVVREHAARNLTRTATLRTMPRYERRLQRLGRGWRRRLLSTRAERRLVERITADLMRGIDDATASIAPLVGSHTANGTLPLHAACADGPAEPRAESSRRAAAPPAPPLSDRP